MLELKNISKSYITGDFSQKALNKISVKFRDSEFVAVLGPSGSGKTTLLNVIGGLDHYDTGDLLINGVSTKKFKEKDWDHYRNNQVGFVFQNYNLIAHQSVLSNVELALTLSGISSNKRKSLAKEALSKVGLKDHIHKKPNQLSGGQQQRVAIARAIVNNPNIIFADEPTGALDTNTSLQIMEILKRISKNKLVVMVTHNPEIAQKYATRIVNLRDAKIVGDSNPIKKDILEQNNKIKALDEGKTSMSFFTALSLSFANLMGKTGRTIMTAIAGSIGIIGISAILALSTGTNQYIKNVENDTLSQYPLQITKSKSIASEFIGESGGGIVDTIKDMTQNNQQENIIGVRNFLTKILTTSGKNDLKSFKKYIDSNVDNFSDMCESIEYSYSANPLIYADDNYGVRELAPKDTISSFGGQSSGVTSAGRSMMGGSFGAMSQMNNTSGFFQLPENENLYKNTYTVSAGRWPQNLNECVLVLHQDGTINDSLLYSLGLRNTKEIDDALQNFSLNKKVDLPENYDGVLYTQVLGLKFKIVNASNLYEYNSKKNIWEDKTSDKAYLEDIVKNKSKNLEIVGIIKPPEGTNTALSISAGINYLASLSDNCISTASESQIVKDQLAKPDIDVLTGKTFEEEKDSSQLGTDLLSDLFEIDTSAFKNIVTFDKSQISPNIQFSQNDITKIISSTFKPEDINKIIGQVINNQQLNEQVKNIVTLAVVDYITYSATHPECGPDIYFAKDGLGYKYIESLIKAGSFISAEIWAENIQQIAIKFTNSINSVFASMLNAALENTMTNLADLNKSFSVNESNLASIFKVNLTDEKLLEISKLMTGATTRSFESNLASFGYADKSDPLQITLYANDFYAKEKISEAIDNYNNNQLTVGNDDKIISYTDYAKLLMSSITTMIDMITAVLVAFVAISLIVSSIMIGIITYISVLEKKRNWYFASYRSKKTWYFQRI